MKKFTVLADSLIGKHGKEYRKGQAITDDQIYPGHQQDLLDQKAIGPYEAPKEPEAPATKTTNSKPPKDK